MTVKITINQLLIAVTTISTILRERRPMPQRGKFAFAKMHTALLPDWKKFNEQRDELIKTYNHHPLVRNPAFGRTSATDPFNAGEGTPTEFIESTEFAVPAEMQEDFETKWNLIGEDEIELDVKPISMKLFDLGTGTDGSIEGAEIIDMGNLITE